MFSTRTIALIGALAAGAATAAHAQPADPGASPAGADEALHKGTLGFAFPFTLLSNVAASVVGTVERVPTIDVLYFLSDKAAVDLVVGVNLHREQLVDAMGNPVDTNLFGFAIGAGYRMYSSKNNLRSFIEPQLVLSWPDASSSGTLALDLGAAFGLERNLTPWFSISGAVGGALNFTKSFKDIQLATSANLAANLYWH